MFDLKHYFSEKRHLIDQALQRLLPVTDDSPPVQQAMHYALMAGGKRLRPILCVAACEALGKPGSDALDAACALELVHTYSLIHDDLPAMDDDARRRGKPTCHIAFGEALAILAGDGLLTLAFERLASGNRDLDASASLDLIGLLARAAGWQGMIEGQARDIQAENQILDQAQLERLHRLKTGKLIQAAVMMGARIGRADARQHACLHDYAGCIGLAFQVVDDILNVEGDARVLGKAVGSDAQRGKNTFPAILGLEPARAYAHQLVGQARDALAPLGYPAAALMAIADYIVARRR
jgi:geranylgeranyl diphosphate synthase type II